MNDIYEIILEELKLIVGEIYQDINVDFNNVAVEPPKDLTHGDIATNCAMVICKQVSSNPREVATKIVEKLGSKDFAKNVEIAGPGFINIILEQSYVQLLISNISNDIGGYVNLDFGNNEKINVEYVSANPTGPLHIGHTRGAVYGDVFSNLLVKTGFDVCREYYVNDGGGQIEKLAMSTLLRIRELSGETIEIPDGCYPGEYIIDVARNILNETPDILSLDMNDALEICGNYAVGQMMDLIKNDLKKIGVFHDVYVSEKKLVENGDVDSAISYLEDKGHVYFGKLEKPKTVEDDDWVAQETLIFKSTKFGDDVDRALKKGDGEYTYFANDVAYHYDKYKRGFGKLVNVWGKDHAGYVKRISSAFSALSSNKGNLEVILCNLVKLLENGEVIKMSKRKGNFVLLSDLIDRVSKDIVRFYIMTRKSDAEMDFDVEKVVETSLDNPIVEIKSCYVRLNDVYPTFTINSSVAIVEDNQKILSLILQYRRLLKSSVINVDPQRISFFLMDMVKSITKFVDDIACNGNEICEYDYNIIKVSKSIIDECFDIIGIEKDIEL